MEKILSSRWKVLFFSIILFTFFLSGTSVQAENLTCVDSDGGLNYMEKGKLSGPIPDGYVTSYDFCPFTGYGFLLTELYCDKDGMASSTSYNCANEGMVCYSGACVADASEISYDLSVNFDLLTYDQLIFTVNNSGNFYMPAKSLDVFITKFRCHANIFNCDVVGAPFVYSHSDQIPQNTSFSVNSNDILELNQWLTQYISDWDFITLSLYPKTWILETTYKNNLASQYPFGADIPAEFLAQQEEQDSAEDLADEITSLDDEEEYYFGYGYGYYDQSNGYDYGYGYGYDGYYDVGGEYGYGYFGFEGEKQSSEKQEEIQKALNPRILPDSPLYWFKLAGNGIRSWLTFDKEDKAKLRMRYASEKILEANKLIDEGESEAAAKHMRRYAKDIEKLQKILEDVGDVDAEKAKELANIALRLRLKEQLLLGKVERESPADELDRVKEARQEALADVRVNADLVGDSRRVMETFELALNVNRRAMNNVRNLEILEAVEQSGLTESNSDAVRDLRERYTRRLEVQVSNLVERDSTLLSDYIERAGGDEVNYLRVLDDLEERVVDERVREEVSSSRERVMDRIETRIETVKERDREEVVREILSTLSDERAEDVRIIREIESRVKPEISASVREVRQELEQRVEERRTTENLPVAETSQTFTREVVTVCPVGFVEQGSYLRDCKQRPENTVCIGYDDGFKWLVSDAINGWDKVGERIQIAKGDMAEYYHLLGTDCIKSDRVGTTPEVIEENISTEPASQAVESREQEGIAREAVTDVTRDSAQREVTTVERVEVREQEVVREEAPQESAVRGEQEVSREAEVRGIETVVPVVEESRCTSDTWDCGDWSACSTDGSQTRTCRISYDCEYVRSATPAQTQSCTPRCTADTWDCGDWSLCSTDGLQTRTCRMSYDCPDASTATPDQTQSCTPTVVTRNPDLTVSSFTYDPTAITAGNAVTFYATVYNQGEGEAGASTAYLYVDGRVIGSLSNSILSAGSRENLSWRSIWTATAGDHTIQVCADASSVLSETNESNNCSSSRFTVTEAVPVGRGASVGVELWEDFVSFFVPVTRAFRFGGEVLKSN